MKRIIIACLLIALMAFTAIIPAAAAIVSESADEARSAETAKAYLTEASFKQYLFEPRNLVKYTIASISQESIAEKTAAYSQFRAQKDWMLYNDTRIASGDPDALMENLELNEKSIAYYAHLAQLSNTEYNYFKPDYEVVRTDTNMDLAIVELYEVLDFQYVELDDTSMVMTHFFVSLLKSDGKWYVMAVESDDPFYEAYRETGIDLESTIEDIDAANEMNGQDQALAESEEGDPLLPIPNPTVYDMTYNQQNAANYALTYTRGSTDNGISGPSTWANTNFYHAGTAGADCQRFASECVWAGLVGNNTITHINAKQAMDTVNLTGGSYRKWCGRTPSGSGEESPWRSTIGFRHYTQDVDLTVTDTDLVCRVTEVPSTSTNFGTSNDIVGTGIISSSQLLGAVLLVRGTPDGVNTPFRHAVVVTKALGITRSTVYFTAYNNCRRNARLSNYYNVSSYNYDAIRVIIPKYMRNGNPTGGNYLYGELRPALAYNTTKTVVGRAHSDVSALTIKIYNPSNTLVYTETASNDRSVSKSVNFNATGLWKVVVSGSSLLPYTFMIRVSASGDLTDDT